MSLTSLIRRPLSCDSWIWLHPDFWAARSMSIVGAVIVARQICPNPGRHKTPHGSLRYFLRESSGVLFFWSGCRELNPVYMHPMHAYYRYTTARYFNTCLIIAKNISFVFIKHLNIAYPHHFHIISTFCPGQISGSILK